MTRGRRKFSAGKQQDRRTATAIELAEQRAQVFIFGPLAVLWLTVVHADVEFELAVPCVFDSLNWSPS